MDPNFLSVVEDAKTELSRLLDEEEGWTVVKKYGQEKEMIIESKPSTTHNCNAYRSTVIIDAPVQVVNETFPLCPFNKHKEWAPDIDDVYMVEDLGKGVVVYHVKTQSIGMVISPRSFVAVGGHDHDALPILRYGVSVDYPKPIKEDGMVRGIYGPYGIRLDEHQGNPNQTRAEVILQIDFKGRLPKKLVDKSIPSSIITSFNHYMEYMKKNGLLTTT